MIETQKNCKARNSNKKTKESVKPEVSFQVSDSKLETRDRSARNARDTRETHASGGDPKDHNTQNKSLRKTGAKQHSSAETGTSESEQHNKKSVTTCAFLPKAMPQQSHPFQTHVHHSASMGSAGGPAPLNSRGTARRFRVALNRCVLLFVLDSEFLAWLGANCRH